MPETIRTANGLRSRPWRGGFPAVSLAAAAVMAGAVPARAEPGVLDPIVEAIGRQDVAVLGMSLALVSLTALAALLLMRGRRQAERNLAAARDVQAGLQSDIDRLKAVLLAEPQVLVDWAAGADRPDITGETSILLPGPGAPDRLLAFGTWLEPKAAQQMERAVEALRGEGRGFSLALNASGRPVEVEGRVVAGRAILRLRDVSGIARERAELAARYEKLSADLVTMRGMLDALPAPVWARGEDGRLIFANAAYARAAEAEDAAAAVGQERELLDPAARAKLAHARSIGEPFSGRLPVIAAGQRRIFDVVEAPNGAGSAGIAIDCTEVETMRAELARMVDAHRRVLDQLATGVAIFNIDRKLTFYNNAFRSLFELDAGFLDQTPTDSAVLDRLRAARKVPEEQDFKAWKQQLYEAYSTVEPHEHMWHLPDGRTLRVVTTPNPQGGVTYLYDDVTEGLELHRRYDSLIKVQSETLDHLTEAVAVFGSDGRARLHNPAFQRMWKLSPEALDQHPHVEQVTAWCHALHDDGTVWRNLRVAVTAIDNREPLRARIERRDGMTIELATVPLPDGATLVTFQDVTDTVNVERALRERNEALEEADEIKIEFVHHVSYELRSPLTNIVGFTHFLADPVFGPLTDKQREYLGYITTSTNALLALINNILDLATIDAGAMTLSLTEVDIRLSMEAAAEGVQDRLVKDAITLDIRAAPAIGSFTADERRLRQILFNLLSNAIGFSPPGATVVLSAERRPQSVVFTVIDQGPGIPPESREKVFDLFETDSMGSEHRGPGLGLSLVRSFVQLHGGSVTIDSTPGQGTIVTCSFPTGTTAAQSAA